MSTINSNAFPGMRPVAATEGVERTLRRGPGTPAQAPAPTPAAELSSAELAADLQAFQTLQHNLASGTGLVAAALGGAHTVARLLGELRGVAVEAANPATAPDRRAALEAEFAAGRAALGDAIEGAGYNERNLLRPGAEGVTFTAALSGGQLTVEGAPELGAVAGALSGGIADAGAAEAMVAIIDRQAGIVGAALDRLGASQKSLAFQSSFVKTIADAAQAGVNSLVDADLAAEAAKIQALQLKQQLGGTSLGIANQRPQTLLSLLK